MMRALSILAAGGGMSALEFLSSGPVRFALLLLFLISLFVALHVPGHGLAEAMALACMATLLGTPLATGAAPWWTVAVVVVGLLLIAIEIFLVPGFGLPGLAGLVLFFGGLVIAFASPDPSANHWRSLQNATVIVTSALIAASIACIILRRYLPQMPYFKRLILNTEADPAGPAAPDPAPADAWPFIGSVGTALTDLKPGGTVEFDYGHDRRTTAVVTDGQYVPAGTKVIVYEVFGNRIVVRSKDDGIKAV